MPWCRRPIAGLGVLALMALAGCGGEPPAAPLSSSRRWVASPDSRSTPNPIAPTAENLSEARALFLENCAGCHNENGDGNGPASVVLPRKAANFTDAVTMATMTDGELFWKMSTGRAPMPAWEESLSANQRWELVNYIRAFARPNGPSTVAAK